MQQHVQNGKHDVPLAALYAPTAVVVSPDNRHVYITSEGSKYAAAGAEVAAAVASDTFQYHPRIQNLNSYTTNMGLKCV